MRRPTLIWSLLLGLLVLLTAWTAVGLTSHQGRIAFEPGWIDWLVRGEDSLARDVLLYLRLPRALAGLLVGAGLALAGLVLQGMTRNPLADPYLLGISGGAGVAVVLLHALPDLVQRAGHWLIPLAAFLGALAACLLVLAFARGGSAGRLSVLGLILAGVVVNALCAALMTFALARFDPHRLRVTTLWLAGGISFTSWTQLLLALALTLAAGIYLRGQAHRLNACALGESGAAHVGVDASRVILIAALVSSLLTAVAVSLGGLLGYVGLVVPHAVRLLVGHDFRRSLPLAALAGALLLTAADTGARLLFAPEELPVGVLTALLGCPVLLLLLRAQLRGRR